MLINLTIAGITSHIFTRQCKFALELALVIILVLFKGALIDAEFG